MAYSSVLSFHLDLKQLISEAAVPADSLAVKTIWSSYQELASQVFPWFDVQRPQAHFDPIESEFIVRRPYGFDHFYAKTLLSLGPANLRKVPNFFPLNLKIHKKKLWNGKNPIW